jgi:cytochrome c553
MSKTGRWVVTCAGALLALSLAVPAAAGPLDHRGYTKAFSCSACHGFAGNSRSDSMPTLAGQQAAYLKKALQDYAAGKRPSPEMEPYAKMAIELGVDDVASYFASQPKQPAPMAVDRAAADRGKAASAACVACHGVMGKGDAAKGVPDITGQPAGYLRSQLMLFKMDKRSPGDPAVMAPKAIIKGIPDATLADLAAYYSSQR